MLPPHLWPTKDVPGARPSGPPPHFPRILSTLGSLAAPPPSAWPAAEQWPTRSRSRGWRATPRSCQPGPTLRTEQCQVVRTATSRCLGITLRP
eukprot:3953377-Prymnesium_polylepis.1